MSTADVKSSIEKALRDTPGLSSSGVIVNVTQSAIELTGSVPSAADKETVRRIAEQNAGGRKVDDAWLVVR
jgi:osmotically-inducible protein OsmY